MSEAGIVGSFDKNEIIINWANQQPLEKQVNCLGDGHDGVGNIFKEISCKEAEVLNDRKRLLKLAQQCIIAEL